MNKLTLILVLLYSFSSIYCMHVSGNKLYDANNNEFIFRGINIAHAWFSDKTEFSISEVASLGANSVRIVLACGKTYAKTLYTEVKQIINWCENYGLVCVLELHDFTGSDDPSDITYTALNYWNEMKDLVNAHKNYVIVNIANEWQGTWNQGSLWGDTYVSAVKSLRSIGIENCIMIDASGYAQETEPVIKDAQRVLASDPNSNVIFSYHVYSALGKDDDTLLAGFNGLRNTGVCWIAGEFGFWQNGGDVVYKTLMSYCQTYGIGWIAWSWSGNGGIDTCLDLTSPNTFSKNDLTSWGKEIFYGTNGIQNTSKKAYSDSNNEFEYCSGCDITATDTDGNKWGYENDKSCKIDTSKCSESTDSDTAPNGFPYCSTCETTDTSEDGTRWGYENDESCVINDSKC